MKIAVFGDSFGDDYNLWPDPYLGVGPSWIDYLRNQNIEIDNYSCGGASLFYGYQRFISTYQKYDKVIFLVTSPGRISVPKGNQTEEFANLTSVENHLKNCVDFETKIKFARVLFLMYIFLCRVNLQTRMAIIHNLFFRENNRIVTELPHIQFQVSIRIQESGYSTRVIQHKSGKQRRKTKFKQVFSGGFCLVCVENCRGCCFLQLYNSYQFKLFINSFHSKEINFF